MGLVWDLGAGDAALQPFQTVANAAAKALPSFGPVTVTAQKGYHMSFLYLCCLTKQEAAVVKAAAADNCGAGWPNLPVQFARVTYQYNKPGAYSVTADVSPQNETRMQAMAKGFEACLQKRGAAVSVARAHQWAFHVTLGSITSEDTFAGAVAAAEANKLDWSRARAVLNKPPKCTGALC